MFKEKFEEAKNLLLAIQNEEFLKSCNQFLDLCVNTLKNKKTIFIAGNGGSHCDAMHFAEELTGRFRKDRKPLSALALGDPSHLTCVSNDYGFEFVFQRQLEALAREGDLFVALSTSGNSKNLILAVQKAKEIGVTTFALLGKNGGELKNLSPHLIVPHQSSERIQEIHMKIIHTVVEGIEKSFGF